jgi:hypothetical protein
MKKLMMGMMVTAFASVAFCDVTPALVSENLFGSIEVKSKSEFTLVAVPFEGFASQFDKYPGGVVATNILARDVIAVDRLLENDTMSIFKPADPNKPGDEDTFHNYIATLASFDIPGYGSYEYWFWNASMAFTVADTIEKEKSPNAAVRLVPVGTGVFIGRDQANLVADAGNDFSIFAYGQIPQNFDYAAPVKLRSGKTILSAVGERAYLPVDINKLDWDGEFTEVSGTPRSNPRYVDRYGVTNILTITSSPATADVIVYYDTETQDQKEFVRYGSRWIRKINATVASLEDDALIPEGQAFWYLRNAESDAQVAWDQVQDIEPATGDTGTATGDTGTATGDTGN